MNDNLNEYELLDVLQHHQNLYPKIKLYSYFIQFIEIYIYFTLRSCLCI